jgi:hypothetical protein
MDFRCAPDVAVYGFRVWVQKKLRGVEAATFLRVEGPPNSVGIALAGPYTVKVSVPNRCCDLIEIELGLDLVFVE